jgi:hypothetical protein
MNARHAIGVLGSLSCLLLLSACSFKATFKETTDTTSNITGTTSGRVWWNEDGLLKPEHKVSAFTAYNAPNLEMDLARGQGEYLASLDALMEKPESAAFHLFAQDVYSRWSQSGSRSTAELVNHMRALPR